MTEQRQMKQIFFDVEESENVYDFAIELRKEYVRRAGKDMAVLNAYNEAEEDRAEAAGEPYHYRMTEPMDPEIRIYTMTGNSIRRFNRSR